MNIIFNEISLSKIKEKCEQDRQDIIAKLSDKKRKTIGFSILYFGLSFLFVIGGILFCCLFEMPMVPQKVVVILKIVVVVLLLLSTIVFCYFGIGQIQYFLFEKDFFESRCEPDYFVNKRLSNLLRLKNCNQILEASFDEDGDLIITIDDNGEVKQIEFCCKGKKTRTDIDTFVINFEVENSQEFSVYIPYGKGWDCTNFKIQNPNDIKKSIVD